MPRIGSWVGGWANGGLLLALVALVGACGSDEGHSDCPDCRAVGGLETGDCSVAIPGYHYVAAPLPYSGAFPAGEYTERGIRQAVIEINEQGGVKGKPLGLILCETASDPDRATAILSGLADVPQISATTCCMRSKEVMPASAVAKEKGILMLSPSATSTLITDLDDDDWVNRTAPPDSLQGTIAAHIAAESGYAKVFVATLDDPYGTSLADVFQEQLGLLSPGVELEQVIYTESGENYIPSMPEVIGSATTFAPDLVYVAGLARDAASLVNVASDEGFAADWLMADGARDQSFIDFVTNKDYIDGIRGTAPSPPTGGFAAGYTEQWGSPPEGWVAAAYDGIYLLAIAMELSTDPDDRVEVRDNLLSKTQHGTLVRVEDVGWSGLLEEMAANGEVDYDGASGPVDLDDFGDVRANIELWGINGGSFEAVECRTPENTGC